MALSLQDLARDIDGKESRRIRDGIRAHLLVKPGERAGLDKRETDWDGGPQLQDLSERELKDAAKEFLAQGVAQLTKAQQLLWASDTFALLVVFQGMDASGKDSTIKHVMGGVNPQGVEVSSFKQPSTEELDHDFLWRISKALPERGRIGIFNRSHYEDVVAVRVHPEWLERSKLPPNVQGPKLWQKRYEDIKAFEHHLHRNGTRILKFFLHVSKKEQKKRFLARLDDPAKQWKFSEADAAERAHWDKYMAAYDDAITATSTEYAPWYVIPADHKPLMRAMVVGVLLDTIAGLDLQWPRLSPEQEAALSEARRRLEAEPE
jgi:PPK2 family polyphosphate:nucleotide phosphotransferase